MIKSAKQFIRQSVEESITIKTKTLDDHIETIVEIADALTQSLKKGGKIIFFGNGGSAADSQHIAAEFIGRFKHERRSLAALALTTDTSVLTALGNDYGFDVLFARQLEGLAKKGDVAIAISTSGNSKNVIEAVKVAKKKRMTVVGFTGNEGGKLAALCDLNLIVASRNTARIQESHICFAHIICELVENNFLKT